MSAEALTESIRFDSAKLSKVERTEEGYLRCDASLGSAGVFTYKNADGSTRREYRPLDEVSRADSLATAVGKPLTNGHPGLVSSRTMRALRVGGPLDTPRMDGNHVLARMQVDDEATIARVDAGDRDISPGYRCREDHTPGVHPVFGAYDLIQRDIRYNHFAVLPKGGGRQGPDVSLRLDGTELAAWTISVDDTERTCDTLPIAGVIAPDSKDLRTMLFGKIEIKLDAKDEAVIAAHISAIEAERDAAKLKQDASDKASAKLEAERDALKVKQDAADAIAAASARKDLETAAVKVLGSTKFDGQTDAQVQAAVVAKAFPGVKLDGKSADYVSALFDQAVTAGAPVTRQDGGPAAVAAALSAGASAPVDLQAERATRNAARGKIPTK